MNIHTKLQNPPKETTSCTNSIHLLNSPTSHSNKFRRNNQLVVRGFQGIQNQMGSGRNTQFSINSDGIPNKQASRQSSQQQLRLGKNANLIILRLQLMQGFNEFSNNKEKEKLQIDIFDGLERIPFNPPSTKSKQPYRLEFTNEKMATNLEFEMTRINKEKGKTKLLELLAKAQSVLGSYQIEICKQQKRKQNLLKKLKKYEEKFGKIDYN